MFHLRTNVPPWGSNGDLARIDAALERAGSTPVGLRWDDLPLQDDGLHFTPDGEEEFTERLARAVARTVRVRSLLVLSDSTIGHDDEDGRAARRLVARFARDGVQLVVDAVCGSGFVAGSVPDNDHFRARISRRLRRRESYSAVLLIGGWNDPHVAPGDVEAAVRGAAALGSALVESS